MGYSPALGFKREDKILPVIAVEAWGRTELALWVIDRWNQAGWEEFGF